MIFIAARSERIIVFPGSSTADRRRNRPSGSKPGCHRYRDSAADLLKSWHIANLFQIPLYPLLIAITGPQSRSAWRRHRSSRHVGVARVCVGGSTFCRSLHPAIPRRCDAMLPAPLFSRLSAFAQFHSVIHQCHALPSVCRTLRR